MKHIAVYFDEESADEKESELNGFGLNPSKYRKVIDNMWGYENGECFEYKKKDK